VRGISSFDRLAPSTPASSPPSEHPPVTIAYINRIATAVPPNDVHKEFVRYTHSLFDGDERRLSLMQRMSERSGIEHRYSCLAPAPDWETGPALDADAFYRRGHFPDTASRMRLFETRAPELAVQAVERLQLGEERRDITHLLITCCTGFSAPGLDIEIIERCGLPSSTERTIVGFMGCYAAINALKLARHIVRSEPGAKVLMLNLELCTLHFQETRELSQVLCFLLFADGCAASLISADPAGIALESFKAMLLPDTRDLMSWHIRELGFDMGLSGQVPFAIYDALRNGKGEVLGNAGADAIDVWAVHPGGRTVLDAVQRAFELPAQTLSASREVLRRYGNMSSPTVMFVLDEVMRTSARGASGCAMSFGPGLVAETMRFQLVG
jgi:predicted naringenin-chalcone synthase